MILRLATVAGLLLVWSALLGGGQIFAQPLRSRSGVFADIAPPNMRGEADDGGVTPNDDIMIETDRDSFTPATSLASERRMIVETAYSYINNRGGRTDTSSFPETIMRYGLNKWLELRIGWNYEIDGSDVDVSAVQGGAELEEPGHMPESRIEYGFKFNLGDQRGWRPRSAAIVQAYTPTSGEAVFTQWAATYINGWQLPGGSRIDTALRYSTASNEYDRYSIWSPSVVWKVPIHKRWAVHAEGFGSTTYDRNRDYTQIYFSPGAHYLITKNTEIGFRLGWGLNAQSAPFFTNIGAGVRF
jgi:hypothetical protein